jgi:hypothetical protein
MITNDRILPQKKIIDPELQSNAKISIYFREVSGSNRMFIRAEYDPAGGSGVPRWWNGTLWVTPETHTGDVIIEEKEYQCFLELQSLQYFLSIRDIDGSIIKDVPVYFRPPATVLALNYTIRNRYRFSSDHVLIGAIKGPVSSGFAVDFSDLFISPPIQDLSHLLIDAEPKMDTQGTLPTSDITIAPDIDNSKIINNQFEQYINENKYLDCDIYRGYEVDELK